MASNAFRFVRPRPDVASGPVCIIVCLVITCESVRIIVSYRPESCPSFSMVASACHMDSCCEPFRTSAHASTCFLSDLIPGRNPFWFCGAPCLGVDGAWEKSAPLAKSKLKTDIEVTRTERDSREDIGPDSSGNVTQNNCCSISYI